jgi:hypothetical protein
LIPPIVLHHVENSSIHDVIRMGCECGTELVFEADVEQLTCECGAVSAVTVSRLRDPAIIEK